MECMLAGKGLQTELDDIIKEYAPQATISYMVTIHNDDEPVRYVAARNEDTVHASASMIKILIMLSVFEAVSQQKLALTDQIALTATPRVEGGGALQELQGNHTFSVLELCRLMMVLSDNWATNLLIRTLGMTFINDTAKKYGAAKTSLKRYMMDTAAAARGDENVTTAYDMIVLLDAIFQIREQSVGGHEMWQILGRQQFRDKLPFHWGEEVPFHHKTGCLDRVEHDGGILPLMNGNFGLVVLISNMDNDEAIQLTARMGRCCKAFIEEKLPV